MAPATTSSKREPFKKQKKLKLAAASLVKAKSYRALSEQALYASWTTPGRPENVYISLFQLYYQQGRVREAEEALERALKHSPHLGAVRANVASLQLERKAIDNALFNAKWVLKVSPSNSMALRVAGRAHQLRREFDQAENTCVRRSSALAISPKKN